MILISVNLVKFLLFQSVKMAKQPSPNPKYKLTYFNMTGLGEPIRMLFAYGGIKYEDNRIETEDWPALNQVINLFKNYNKQ